MHFNSHKITNRANSTLGFLRRNLKHCPETLKKTAYIYLIRSVLEYSDTVWDPFVQRRSVLFVCHDYSRCSSVSAMVKHLNLTPLANRRRHHRLTLLYKIVNNLVAIPSDDFIKPNSQRTRQNHTKTFKTI